MKKTKGQIWWASLTQEQKDAYISRRERTRVKPKKKNFMKDERWTNRAGTFEKTWKSKDSYSVTRVVTLL